MTTSTPKIIAVLGVTGNQGGSVAHHFLTLGYTVRGITRSTTSTSAQKLASLGVQLVTGDIDDPDSLIPAFRGAHVIFAVTDFWAPYFANFEKLSQISDRATGEHAFGIEVQRGKNIVDAAAKVLGEEGAVLKRFIWSTLPSFREVSGGKYTFAYHFDSKAEVSNYLGGKGELWKKSSLLNAGFYVTNMIKYGFLKGRMGKHESEGKKKYVYKTPGSPGAKHPFFVPADTGVFVELLVKVGPGQDLLGVSEMASYEDYMREWTRVTGVESEVKEVSVEDEDKASPGGIGREAAESTASSAEFGWGKELVLPTDLDPEIRTTILREYMKSEDWESFLAKI